MDKKNCRLILILLIASILLFAGVPRVYSIEATAQNQAYSFLANVLDFNMSSYDKTVVAYAPSSAAPPNTGFEGLPVESITVNLTSTSTHSLAATFTFVNGTLELCGLWTYDGSTVSPLYSQAEPSTVLGEVKWVLQSYENYNEAAYVQPMLNMLDTNPSLNGLNNATVTTGNLKCTIEVDDGSTTLNWHYVADGVDYDQKCLSLVFSSGILTSFSDKWSFYQTSNSLSINVPEQKAENLAWNAANTDDPNVTVTLTDNPQAALIGDVDNLTLRPIWVIQFYSNNGTVNVPANGVEVGVWADNGQIAYCTIMGYLEISNTPPSSLPTASPSQPNKNAASFDTSLTVGAAAITITAIAVAAWVFRKRSK